LKKRGALRERSLRFKRKLFKKSNIDAGLKGRGWRLFDEKKLSHPPNQVRSGSRVDPKKTQERKRETYPVC